MSQRPADASGRALFGILRKVLGFVGIWPLFIAGTGLAETNAFLRQMISLPSNVGASRFVDLGQEGRLDLLAIDPVGKQLWIYRQRRSGFTNSPDQIIELPPQTGWVGAADVDPHPGVELVMSTATGLVYCRQTRGVFEPQPRNLVAANQFFTNVELPPVVSLGTNWTLPVLFESNAVLYHRNDAFEWTPGRSMGLAAKHSSWRPSYNDWTVGANSSHTLRIQNTLTSKPVHEEEEKPENDAVRKAIEEMGKAAQQHHGGTNVVDLNGDGRKDLVLWQTAGDRDPKTDVYVFLRGLDGRLPDLPTQVVHCRGFPIPVGSAIQPSPIGDLNGDGTCELVLLELKTTVTSASSLVETLVSRGLDWALTIRLFKQGMFSRSPDGAVPLKALLPEGELREWPLFICGDFNGDGRPDLVVQRSMTQWNIFFSTSDGRWFAPQPAMGFETALPGYFELAELNGDHRSDLVLRALDEPRIYVYLTQPQHTEGKTP